MDALLDSPFAPTIAACLLAGLGLSLLVRLVRVSWPVGLVAPVVFLTAYYFTYNKIPLFPPVGSTNKIFYIALAATVLGLLLDLFASRRIARPTAQAVTSVLVAAVVAVWIAMPRLASPDLDLVVVLAALVLGGAVLLWHLAALDTASADPVDAAVLFAVLPGVFAPIALFGGSSTSVGLCLGLVAGLAMAALVGLFAPRRLGMAGVLGAGAGLLAMIDTITLITRKMDFLALAVFLTVLFVGRAAARMLQSRKWPGPRLRAVAVGAMAASPIVVILIVLLLRYDSPF